jgi:hypothetical protein
MITVIAVIVCLILLAVKLLADATDKPAFTRLGTILLWFIVPLVVLFLANVTVKVANAIPNASLFS